MQVGSGSAWGGGGGGEHFCCGAREGGGWAAGATQVAWVQRSSWLVQAAGVRPHCESGIRAPGGRTSRAQRPQPIWRHGSPSPTTCFYAPRPPTSPLAHACGAGGHHTPALFAVMAGLRAEIPLIDGLGVHVFTTERSRAMQKCPMPTQRYSVTPHPIETLLTWVKSGEIAIPEIQRPFVWDATKVRNLLDSLYQRLSGRLSHRLAEPDGEAEGWHLVGGQAHPDRRPAARHGPHGGPAWYEVLTKDYDDDPGEDRFPSGGGAVRGI